MPMPIGECLSLNVWRTSGVTLRLASSEATTRITAFTSFSLSFELMWEQRFTDDDVSLRAWHDNCWQRVSRSVGDRVRRLRLARNEEERERRPWRTLANRNAQGEDMEEAQTVPLRIRDRGKRPVNRIGKSFSNGDSERLRDSDWNAIVSANLWDSLQDDVSVVHAIGGVETDFPADACS